MALHDNPPHSVATYSVESSEDDGGGVTLTYTVAQSGVACSINTAGASTVELFAQDGIRVTHTVAFLSSVLTTDLTRGMKLVATDTSAAYHVKGIRLGRSYGRIPAFVYADVEEQL